jgi:hypothetical protein
VFDILEQTPMLARQNAGERTDYVDTGLASNAWGIGSELSATGAARCWVIRTSPIPGCGASTRAR